LKKEEEKKKEEEVVEVEKEESVYTIGSVEYSEYEYTYVMPTEKIEQDMKDFVAERRTLHSDFYPPKERLKLYRRKILMEEKEENEIEAERIKKEMEKWESD